MQLGGSAPPAPPKKRKLKAIGKVKILIIFSGTFFEKIESFIERNVFLVRLLAQLS